MVDWPEQPPIPVPNSESFPEDADNWVQYEADLAVAIEEFDGEITPLKEAVPTILSLVGFKGLWSAQVGALALPASVYHSGEFWTLLQPLADVTSKEPGVDDDYWDKVVEATIARLGVEARTGDTEITDADHGKVILFSGASSFSQTLDALANFTDGFYIDLVHLGTGTITLDADGTEVLGLVNQATTCAFYPGERVRLTKATVSAVAKWALDWSGPSGRPQQVFTSSGTYTPRPDKVRHRFRRWNGGQAAPVSVNSSNLGAGSACYEGRWDLTAAGTVTVGAGGASNSASGGTTTMTGSTVEATYNGSPAGNVTVVSTPGMPGLGVSYGRGGIGDSASGGPGNDGAAIIWEA